MRTGRRSKKLDNRGLSLIELVVVIAIITVLAGTIAITAGSISRYNVKKMAETFDQGLSRTQTLCMGKDRANTYLVVYKEGGSTKMKVTRLELDETGAPKEVVDTTEYDLGSDKNEVKCLDASGNELGFPFAISFDRASGAYKGQVKLKSGSTEADLDSNNKLQYYDKFVDKVTFANEGGNNLITVKLFKYTGKHEIVK